MTTMLSAILEIGTNRTSCWIGEQGESGLRLIARSEVPSGGVRAGEVADVRALAASIASAVAEAEASSGLSVQALYVGLSGSGVTGTLGRAAVPVVREGQEIAASDMRRALDRAGSVAMAPGAVRLHILPQRFSVDGNGPIRDPVGLTGAVLEAEVVVLSGSAFAAENASRAVRMAGRNVAALIAAPAAVGLGALSGEERELGALVIDFGAGTTSYAAWCGGELERCGCVPLGGEAVTRDIAVGLGISRESAEALKCDLATAYAPALLGDEARVRLKAPSLGGEGPAVFDRAGLAEIVEARVEEILLLIKRRLEGIDPMREFGAGVVLAGGAARQSGLEEKVREVLGSRTRIAKVDFADAGGLDLAGPEHALGAGLLSWACGGAALDDAETSTTRPVRWLAGAVRWLAAGF